MRGCDLLKPDLLSEVVLTVVGAVVIILLGSITWVAVLSH